MAKVVSFDWEVQINRQVVLSKYCLWTNDFGINNNLLVTEHDQGTDHAATFKTFLDDHGLDKFKDTPDTIKNINNLAVNQGQESYNQFSQTVNALTNTPPDQETWEKTIDDAGKTVKEKALKVIDDTANSAKQVIKQLPESARQAAANLFCSGLKTVMAFFETVWQKIKDVAAAVYEFLKGRWEKLTNALAFVKNAATTAIDAIRGTFAFLEAETRWPLTNDLKTIASELGGVLDDLAKQEFLVDDLHIRKTGAEWAAQVSISSAGSKEEIERAWKTIVEENTSAKCDGFVVVSQNTARA